MAAAKGLPFAGKMLLQRTVIKIGIRSVEVPACGGAKPIHTAIAGRHAQTRLPERGRVIELAENLSEQIQRPQLMLWVAWLVIKAVRKALLIRHLVRVVRNRHQVVDERLARLVEVDPAKVWRLLDAGSGDLSDIIDVAFRVATVDGAVNSSEKAIISELERRAARI